MNKKVKHQVVVYDGLTLGDLLDNLPDNVSWEEDQGSYFHFDYSKDEFNHTEVIVALRYS